MNIANEVIVLQKNRLKAQASLSRGDTPNLTLEDNPGFFQILFFAVVAGVIVALLVWFVGWLVQAKGDIIDWAINLGSLAFCLVVLLPFILVFFSAIRHASAPDFSLIRGFSWGHRLLASMTLAFLVVLFLKTCHILPLEPTYPFHGQNRFLTPGFLAWLVLTSLLMVTTACLSRLKSAASSAKRNSHLSAKVGVWLGESTGHLAELSHKANMAARQQVGLFGDDLAQNILILGAIGSGKTTRAVHPLLIQLLEQQCGGLIFDIKGDFHQAVAHFASLAGRHYQTLGVGKTSFNLLAGLTPEMAASFLKSAFLLSGNTLESFWIETASELCRNALGVLSFVPEHYNLSSLYLYVFDVDFHQTQWETVNTLAKTLGSNDKQLLASYQRYETMILPSFDDKVIRSVKATLAQVLSPFQHPDLIQTFCTHQTEETTQARLDDILSGSVFLVDLPLSRWGLGAKVVYMLIKLRFFNIMQQRPARSDWNQSCYAFFICDEYQEIVSANKDGLSDLNFWDKSRSSKTIGIISAQSVSSFYAAIGNRDLAHALLQNFRQKLCFRTEDQNTLTLFNQLFGTVQVARVTTGNNESTTSKFLEQSSTTEGVSKSLSIHDKPLLDGQFFRTLTADQVLAVLSVGGQGFDDVLKVQPYFLK